MVDRVRRTAEDVDAALQTAVLGCAADAVNHYEHYEIADACADVISIFRHCNKYIDETTPWVLAKSEDGRGRLASVLANLTEAIRIGCALFTPVAPGSAAKIAGLFGFASEELAIDTLDSFRFCAEGRSAGECGVLFARIHTKKLEEQIKQLSASKDNAAPKEKANEPAPGVISIDEFQKVSLRVGEIAACEPVPKSDKLLKLSVDLGGEQRQVVAGVAEFYTPESLVGKKIILVANLKPVKLRAWSSNWRPRPRVKTSSRSCSWTTACLTAALSAEGAGMFDSHAHYDDARFDGDRDALLAALFADGGVSHIVNAATDLPSARACEALSAEYPGMYHAVGVHPQEADKAQGDYLDALRLLAENVKAVAVGEIGLDYHYDTVPRDVQRRVFAEQLELACALGLPAVIHDREAHKDCIDEVLARSGAAVCFPQLFRQ